jgi:hypothetical protein
MTVIFRAFLKKLPFAVLSLVWLLLFAFPVTWGIIMGPLFLGGNCYPFLDLSGVLAAFESYALGFDVIHHPIPLDYLGRTHPMPWIPHLLGYVGVTAAWTPWIMLFFMGAFLFMILHLFQPKKWIEALSIALLLCSPPLLMGVERANLDFIFVVIFVGLVLYCEQRPSPLRCILTALIIGFLTLMKFFPLIVVLIFWLLPINWKRKLLYSVLSALPLMVYGLFWSDEFHYIMTVTLPRETTLFAFGANLIGVPFGLIGNTQVLFIKLVFVLIGVLLFFMVPASPLLRDPKTVSITRLYLLGAALLVFCFMASSNHGYRMLYFVPMLPLLVEMSFRDQSIRFWALTSRWLIAWVIAFLWIEGLFLMMNNIFQLKMGSLIGLLIWFHFLMALPLFLLIAAQTLSCLKPHILSACEKVFGRVNSV